MANDDGSNIGKTLDVARQSFERLTGQSVDSISSAARDDGMWRLGFEVVELERIPDSTSLLGSYEVMVNDGGRVVSFVRLRRYYRNRADEEST